MSAGKTSPCKIKYFSLDRVLNRKIRYLQPQRYCDPMGNPWCQSHICLFVDDSLKAKVKEIFIAIGQKHTQHRINKYFYFCPIATIHYAFIPHLAHTKLLSATF